MGTAAAVVLSGAAIIATDGLGSIQALSALISPAQVIAPAPEGVSWVRAPASPMVEAGRTAEGGLDVRQMMHAWQDAGMNSWEASRAMALVAQMRPLLLGRVDPLAHAEQTLLAQQAANQLAALFPEVIDNLAQGKVVASQDLWELADWSESIDTIEMGLAHDLPLGSSRDHRSLARNFADRQSWDAEHPGARSTVPALLQLIQPSVPSSDKGVHDDLISLRLLDVLQRAGVPAAEAADIHDLLIDATLPLDELPSAVVKERLETTEELNEEIVLMLGEDNWTRVQLAAASEQFNQPDLSADQPQMWDDVRSSIRERHENTVPASAPGNVSMQDAERALETAVQEVGLRSLTPSLWQMRSPQSMMELAQNLKIANAEIGHAVGWDGKVLGLDGRLELSMGPIMQRDGSVKGVAAAVAADHTGRLQMISGWKELGHEWFHAFDHVAARYSLDNPSNRPLTENAQLLRGFTNADIKRSIRALNESLTDGSPRWEADRERANDRDETHYYTRGTEVGAYAFAGFLTNQGAVLLANEHTRHGNFLEPYTMPSPQEQAHQAAFFTALFKSTQPLNLSGAHKAANPQMKQVEMWRASRSTVDALRDPDRRPAFR